MLWRLAARRSAGRSTGDHPSPSAALPPDDLEARLWTVPGSRTKNRKPHLVSLNRLAMEILKTLPQTDGYLLRGARGKNELAEAAASFELDDFCGHDLRRTATTLMRKAKVPRADVTSVINHTPREGGQATKHYDLYDMLPEKQRALATWDRVLRRIFDAEQVRVLPFPS